MKPIIAVEGDLTNVSQALEEDDYSPVNLRQADLDSVDAVIISGENKNAMGVMNTITDVPVIDAGGKTAEEVKNRLSSTFAQKK